MKKFLALSIILLTCQLASAQIPNGGFESWTQEFNYETPTGWESNQDTFYLRVEKDSLSVEGNYSLKLNSNVQSAFFDCSSTVGMQTKFDEPVSDQQNISFYLRCIPDNPEFIFFELIASYYKDGQLESYESYIPEQTFEEFTQIEMEDIPLGVDSLKIVIFSGALNGADDGCYNFTNSWVDDLKINTTTTAVHNKIEKQIEIFPNPSSGFFNIQQESNEYKTFRVLNILGKEILRGTLENSSFYITRRGPYILQLHSSKGREFDVVRKIIVK